MEKIEPREISKSQYFLMVVSILVIAVCATMAAFFIRKAFSWQEVEKNKAYGYQITKNVDYQVNLIENNFIQTNPQPADELYIERLIQSIPATFQYRFVGDESGSFTYNYYVEARVVANYKSSEEGKSNTIWNKVYTLVPTKTSKASNTNQFTINVPVQIDYQKFSSEVKAFIRQLALSIDAELQVNLFVDVNGEVTASDKVSFVVPLNQEVLKVARDKNVILDNNKKANIEVVTKINYIDLILGITFFVVAIVFVVVLASELLKRSHKSRYYTEVRKLLNDYGEIIVEVTEPIIFKGKQRVNLRNFNEMIDLEQELRIPILCYQNEVFGVTTFSICKDDTYYVYELKQSELDKIEA